MWRISPKFLHLLTYEQKGRWIPCVLWSSTSSNNPHFFSNLSLYKWFRNKTAVLTIEISTVASLPWKARQVQSEVKSMLFIQVMVSQVVMPYSGSDKIPTFWKTTRSIIIHLVQKFELTNRVCDSNKGMVRKHRPACMLDNIACICKVLLQSLEKFVTQYSQPPSIKRTSTHTIMQQDLTLYPYKIQVVQMLTAAHKQQKC